MSDDVVPAQNPNATVDATEPGRTTVAFRVCWGDSADRAPGAVLILTPADGAARPATPLAVDEDGDLEVELENGEWSCAAMHADGRQLKPRPLKVPDDVPEAGQKIVLRLTSLTRDISQAWGRWTFAILIGLLAALVWTWVHTHRLHPDPAPPSRASAMLDAAARVRAALAEAEDPRQSARFLAAIDALGPHLDSTRVEGELKRKLDEIAKHKARMELLLLNNSEQVVLALRQLEAGLGGSNGAGGAVEEDGPSIFEPVKNAVELAVVEIESGTAPNESARLAELVEQLAGLRGEESVAVEFRQTLDGHEQKLRAWLTVEEEMGNGPLKALLLEEIEGLESQLAGLAAVELELSRGTARSVLWSRPPKLYLEILFWATAGILVQLIITIAGYLRWNTFIKNGIYLHVALLITVPLLTLVFVQIISMGRLTADDSTVVLDLSDPRIVAGAAFLIALVPWRLWDRIRGAGRKVIGDTDS